MQIAMRYVSAFVFVVLTAALLTACGGASGVTQTSQTQNYAVQLHLDTTRLGNQTVMVEVNDRAGQPVVADRVVVSPVMEVMGMASPESTAKAMGPGRYQAENVYFSMTGDWEVDVRVSAAGKNEVARFKVNVAAG